MADGTSGGVLAQRPRLKAMRKAGDLQGLIDELENPDEFAYQASGKTFHFAVRSEAAQELGKIGDPRAVSSVAKLLGDPHFSVRVFAAIALGNIGDRAACGPLIAALEDEDVSVRYRAAQSLGKIGERSAGNELAEALSDDGAGVRGAAALALAGVGAWEHRGAVGHALRRESPRHPLTMFRLGKAYLLLIARRLFGRKR